jgi:carbonic anhydrase/acetyltransferase-like protein (isoleucine patch superfamily)
LKRKNRLRPVETGGLLRFDAGMSDERDQHMERLRRHLGRLPSVGEGVYIAEGATVLGDVTLGDHSSIWPGVVLRGDINSISVGAHSNIQDNSVVHLADDFGCHIGEWTTIGHSAVIHACTIGNECLIGMGAIVLDGAKIGDQCLIGAGALVTGGSRIPSGSMVLGSPAKVVKPMSEAKRQGLKWWAQKYVWNAEYYLKHRVHLHQPIP